MEYRNLGRSGLKVSRLCFGTLNLGGPTSEEDGVRMIHRALDAGMDFIDTADYYQDGRSELIVGKAVEDRRDRAVVATKVFFGTGEGPNDRGTSRKHIMKQVEISLRRLRTDYVDLLQLHRPDPDTPIDETLRTLDDLVRQGKVRYIGTSWFVGWQLVEALWTSDKLNLERPISEQPSYSLLDRTIEKELAPVCRRFGIGLITFGALAQGFLTGKYRRQRTPPPDSRGALRQWDLEDESWEPHFKVVRQVEELASDHGVPESQFSLAWVLSNPDVTSAIIGPRTMAQLEDSLAASELELNADELAAIDELVPPGTGTRV